MKLSFLVSGLFAFSSLMAQKKEGVLIYERKQNMHKTISEEMRAMIPEFRSSKHMLMFTELQSLYKTLPKDEAPDPFGNNRGGVFMNVGSGSDETYIHFGQNKKIHATGLFGDAYLITDTLTKYDWNLTDETKTIAGFVCKKATTRYKAFRSTMRMVSGVGQAAPPAPKQEEVEVIAWYAVELTSPAGPDKFIGLPGVIMELDIDKGATVFTAEEFRPLDNVNLLKEPKKGRKVTPEEYKKETMKVIENMRSGGSIQIQSGQ
jgi:GLPGLI family protein